MYIKYKNKQKLKYFFKIKKNKNMEKLNLKHKNDLSFGNIEIESIFLESNVMNLKYCLKFCY